MVTPVFQVTTAISTKTLTLDNHSLTLVSGDSDLTVTDNLTFDNSSEQIITGSCRFNLAWRHHIGITGLLSSTGGISFIYKKELKAIRKW